MDPESHGVDEDDDSLSGNADLLSCSAPQCSSLHSSGKRSLSLDASLGSSIQSLESAHVEDLPKYDDVLHTNTPCDPRPFPNLPSGTASASASPKSLFSRLSKTLEDRIGKIRSERGRNTNLSSHESDLAHIGLLEDECISFSHLASESKNDELYSKVSDDSPSDCFKPLPPTKLQVNEANSTNDSQHRLTAEKKHTSPSVFDIRFRNRKDGRGIKGISLSSSLSNRALALDFASPPKIPSSPVLDVSIEDAVEAEEDPSLSILDEKSVHFSNIHEKNFQGKNRISTFNSSVIDNLNLTGKLSQSDVDDDDDLGIMNLTTYLPVKLRYYWKMIIVSTIFITCFVLPMPRFLAGLIFGLSISISSLYVLATKFLLPQSAKAVSEDKCVQQEQITLTSPSEEDNLCFKGWLNKLDGEYHPEEHHVSKIHCIFVRLHGTLLMVDHPRKKVHKHAHFEEKLDSGGFVHHRDYDLSGASVTLEPDYLPRRWLWSRKYPVCVRLRRTARLITSSIPADLLAPLPDDEENEKKSTISEEDESAGGIDATLGAAELDSFEHVTEDMCFEEQLYFFARSDRDKEIWFRRFVAAAQLKGESTWESDAVFRCYMDRLLHPWQPVTPEVSWINILAGRLLYDFLHNPYWANKIQERIQRKLSKVHLPPLVGELVVCGVTAGKAIPQLHSVDPPVQDNCGLWCDLSVQYDGNFTMTIETKIDLMKLKRGDSVQGGLGNSSGPVQEAGARVKRSSARFAPHGAQFRELHFDTDTDDSVESSSDDEDVTSSEVTSQSSEGVSPPGGGRRLMKLVDTLTGSRYFQQATDWGILRKAMKGVSNTRIVLSVRVEKLCGVLAVNIPPQPSDRIWYGFRTRPKLVMKAEPKLGDQPLSLPFLSNFIERQLRKVFEKIFVLPNMDDLVVPIMSPLLPGQASLPKPPWEIAESPTAPLLPSPGFEATTTPF